FELKIDDEIHGKADMAFLNTVNPIYDKRTSEVIAIYKAILAKPFDFSVKDYYDPSNTKLQAPKTEAERQERWMKRLKLLTLDRYVDLLEQREKSKIDSIANRTDEMLEKEAREKVLKIMDRTYDRIKAKFNDDERFNMFVNVITGLMDPHTDYMAPVDKRAFDEQMSGRFYGIGAQLREEDGGIKIVTLLPGGPAMKSGEFMINDAIIKVGQGNTGEMVDISGYAVDDAVKLIRGNKNTEVRLTIKRNDGTQKTVKLVRDEIVQDEVFARSIVIEEDNKKIGYISLPEFYADFERPNGARCSEDVAKEILKLKQAKVDGIVMDLRFNGGGSLYEVAQMVGLFIKSGPVVLIKDRSGKNTVLEDKDERVLYDGPLAVMVNETSASASEIFAAAIQDYKRGVVIGSSSTYGKGTVQKTVPFGRPLDYFSGRTEFGAVKLTFQKFYRVNGQSTQLKGIVPDVVLPDPYEYYKIREKDNVSALPWDEVAKVPYTEFYGYEAAINKARKKIAENPVFKIIENNTKWLAKVTEAPVPLQIEEYKAQQKQQRSTVNQNNELGKLSNDLNVKVLDADYAKFYQNVDKNKGERYQQWMKGVKNDIYVAETVKILTEMTEDKMGNVAKK
ncbi:MAG: carboxy terminal-processing peptidase, partial [Chitinophagaceae bacterium]